jgi:hypothetical protein
MNEGLLVAGVSEQAVSCEASRAAGALEHDRPAKRVHAHVFHLGERPTVRHPPPVDQGELRRTECEDAAADVANSGEEPDQENGDRERDYDARPVAGPRNEHDSRDDAVHSRDEHDEAGGGAARRERQFTPEKFPPAVERDSTLRAVVFDGQALEVVAARGAEAEQGRGVGLVGVRWPGRRWRSGRALILFQQHAGCISRAFAIRRHPQSRYRNGVVLELGRGREEWLPLQILRVSICAGR